MGALNHDRGTGRIDRPEAGAAGAPEGFGIGRGGARGGLRTPPRGQNLLGPRVLRGPSLFRTDRRPRCAAWRACRISPPPWGSPAIGIRPAAPLSWQEAFEQLAAFLNGLETDRKRVGSSTSFPAGLAAFPLPRRPGPLLELVGLPATAPDRRDLRFRRIVDDSQDHPAPRRASQPRDEADPLGALYPGRDLPLSAKPRREPGTAANARIVPGAGRHCLLPETSRAGPLPAQVIDDLCFSPAGALTDEFGQLYASLFEHPQQHVKIIRLGRKHRGLTRNEILRGAGPSRGRAPRPFSMSSSIRLHPQDVALRQGQEQSTVSAFRRVLAVLPDLDGRASLQRAGHLAEAAGRPCLEGLERLCLRGRVSEAHAAVEAGPGYRRRGDQRIGLVLSSG